MSFSLDNLKFEEGQHLSNLFGVETDEVGDYILCMNTSKCETIEAGETIFQINSE